MNTRRAPSRADGDTARPITHRGAGFLALVQLASGGVSQPTNPTPDSMPSPSDTVWTMAANPEYEASGLWRFFWGDHYREVWATPVQVPVLDLDRFAGGLRPEELGGGLQTKSLELRGADGRRYNFRSVDKEPSKAIPKWLRPTPAEDILQDQISSEHPYGALIASALMDTLGILHARPTLYVMPDHPALGEFREDFAGVLGLLEVHADENDESEASPFRGAVKVFGTDDLYEAIEENPHERVASREYLKARLFDIWIGDWDRHGDQWRWARFPGEDLWHPVPEDRDNAFAKLDGFFPSRAHWADGRMVGFEEEYPDLVGLHLGAREMDRRFLTRLTLADFDSVAAEMTERLSVAVIDEGVAALPPEIDRLHGDDMRRILSVRRDRLRDVAHRFYAMLAEEAEVYATDASELLSVEMTSEGSVVVSIRVQGDDEPHFVRRFDPAETKELRVWLEGGDDRVEIHAAELPLRLRVVGGGGDDVYVFPRGSADNVWLYDDQGDPSVGPPEVAHVDTRHYDEWEFSEEDTHPPRDWGSRSRPNFKVSVSSDYGLLVGVGLMREGYGFRREPYSSRLQGTVAAATHERIELEATLDLRAENSPNRLFLRALATQFDILNFYGLGNDTKRGDRSSDFFDVRLNRVELAGMYSARPSDRLEIGIGPVVRFSDDGRNEGRFIDTQEGLYGRGSFFQAGLGAELDWSSGESAAEQTSGVAVEARGQVMPPLGDVATTYGVVESVARAYVPLPLGDRYATLAFRAGGSQVIGDAPWFDAAYLGGSGSIRGFASERFAGDRALFGNAELRLGLFEYDVIVPQTFGVLALADAGRVWLDGDSPGEWHTAFGGGVWVGLLDKRHRVSAVVASSREGSRAYIGVGLPY